MVFRVRVRDEVPPASLVRLDALDFGFLLSGLLRFTALLCVLFVQGFDLFVVEVVGGCLFELAPSGFATLGAFAFVLLKYRHKFGKFQTLISGAVLARLETVEDDGPLL